MGNCGAKPDDRPVKRQKLIATEKQIVALARGKDVPRLLISTAIDNEERTEPRKEISTGIDTKRGIFKLLCGGVAVEHHCDTFVFETSLGDCSYEDYTQLTKNILNDFISSSAITIEKYEDDMKELFRGASNLQKKASVLKLTSLIKKTLIRITERGVAKPPTHQSPGLTELQTSLSVLRQYCMQEHILTKLIEQYIPEQDCCAAQLEVLIYKIFRKMGISGSFGDTYLDTQRLLPKNPKWSQRCYVLQVLYKCIARRKSIHPIQLTNKQAVASRLYELTQIPQWSETINTLTKLEQVIDCSLSEVALFVAMQQEYAIMTFEYLIVKEVLPLYEKHCQIDIVSETPGGDPLKGIITTSLRDTKTTVVVAFSGPRDSAEEEQPILRMVEVESVVSESATNEDNTSNPDIRRLRMISFISAPLALEWFCFRTIKSLDPFAVGFLGLHDVRWSAFLLLQSALSINLLEFHDKWVRIHGSNSSKITLEILTENCYVFLEEVLEVVSAKTHKRKFRNNNIVTNYLRGVKGSTLVKDRLSNLLSQKVLIRRVIREQINCTVGANSSDPQPKAGLRPPSSVDLSLFTSVVSLLLKRCGIYQPEDLYSYYLVLYKATSVNGKLPHLVLEDLVMSALRVVLFKLENSDDVNYDSWGRDKKVIIQSHADDHMGTSNMICAAKNGYLEAVARGMGLGIPSVSSFYKVGLQRSISVSSASSLSSTSSSPKLVPRRCSLFPMIEVLPRNQHCGVIHPSPPDFDSSLYHLCTITGLPYMHVAYMTPSHSLSCFRSGTTFKTVLKAALGISSEPMEDSKHDSNGSEYKQRLALFLGIPGSIDTIYQVMSQSNAGTDASSTCSTPHLGNSSNGGSSIAMNSRSELLLIMIQLLVFIGFPHERYCGILIKCFMGGFEGHAEDIQILKTAFCSLASAIGIENASDLLAFQPIDHFQGASDRLDALNRMPSTPEEICSAIPHFTSQSFLEWHQIPFLFRTLFAPVKLNLVLFESDLNDFFYDETKGAGIMPMETAITWIINKIDVLKCLVRNE